MLLFLFVAAEDYFYTLRDVLFFLENADRGVAEFRRMCVEKRVTAVVEQDKQSLKSYLTGEIDGCHQLDLTAVAVPSQVTQQVSAATAGTSSTRYTQKEMQEHRDRHAALIDQSVQRQPLGLNQTVTFVTYFT